MVQLESINDVVSFFFFNVITFANTGSRLRANEEKAQFFASKVDQMLRTIINSPNSISSAAMVRICALVSMELHF